MNDSSDRIADILHLIVDKRRERVEQAKAAAQEPGLPVIEGEAPKVLTPRDNRFLAAIARHRGRAIVAEVKLGSPRLGSLVAKVKPAMLATTYAECGATALSVVVEPDHFLGSYGLLEGCRRVSDLPTLAKDFVIDEIQLRWAKKAGAEAVLLIAALLAKEELHDLARKARILGLMPLVEVHDLSELFKLEGASWEMIGVNNRNLRTFEVELENAMALSTTLPLGPLRVAESGIFSRKEIEMLRGMGFDAFLVGEALVTAEDPGAKLKELLGEG